MELKAKLARSGNSFCFRIKPGHVHAGLLKLGTEYIIQVKDKLDVATERNKILKRKIQKANEILKENGLEILRMPESIEDKRQLTKQIDDQIEILRKQRKELDKEEIAESGFEPLT